MHISPIVYSVDIGSSIGISIDIGENDNHTIVESRRSMYLLFSTKAKSPMGQLFNLNG